MLLQISYLGCFGIVYKYIHKTIIVKAKAQVINGQCNVLHALNHTYTLYSGESTRKNNKPRSISRTFKRGFPMNASIIILRSDNYF